MSDDRQLDHLGPQDAAHKAVHDAAEHLVNGRVTSAPARKQLRDALDQADKAPVGPDWEKITGR